MFDDKEVQEMRLTPLRVNATSLTMIEANVVTIMMVMIMLLMLIAIMICNNGDDDMDDDDMDDKRYKGLVPACMMII